MSIKISDLPAASIANDADIVPLVQGGTTKKAAISLVRPAFGTGPTNVCVGNDPRLSDSRTPTGAASGDLTGTYPSPELTTTGVTASTYGSVTQVGQFSVDAKGRITSAASVAIDASAIGAIKFTDLGTGVSAFLETPTSANLAAALTDEVGTGSVVFASGVTGTGSAVLASGVVGTGSAVLASGVTGSGDAVLATTPTVQNPTINGYLEGVTSVTVASNYTISIATSTVIIAQLTSGTTCTFAMPALQAGKSFALYLKQPSTGTAVNSVTFTNVVWSGGLPPSTNNTLGRLDIFSFVSDGNKWYGNVSKNYVY